MHLEHFEKQTKHEYLYICRLKTPLLTVIIAGYFPIFIFSCLRQTSKDLVH